MKIYKHYFLNHGERLSEVCAKCGYERTFVARAVTKGWPDADDGCPIPPLTRLQYGVAWLLSKVVTMILWLLSRAKGK